ncbi:MAG TPA: Gfo/Idh/MocA family oxidoreductase [Gemmatimonadaceae bacterium]|nr:Gfo/Idh/MocA family oxidoreductase [Gemmatimonadaceae bacterium]
MPLERRLRYGMVGGGPGAFIGAVHRRAVTLDGLAELTAGAFSADPAKARAQGRELGLDPARVYASYEAMAEREAARPAGERIDFVSIVTPTHLHFPVAAAFVERGFHVVCDKPMTTMPEDAERLRELVERQGVVFALTHNYSGYPLVKHARALVAGGAIGRVIKVVVEYAQDWLAAPLEVGGHKQAEWRTDPARAGVSSSVADIGSHAEHLARYVTGLEIERLCADLTTFVEGRRLEDDANMLLHYRGGARGILYCSQVSSGEENNLRLRVYGTEGSLDWRQEEPNALHLRRPNAPAQVLRRGQGYLAPAAQRAARLPPGHPEGFHEAFANVYANAMRTIAARVAGEPPDPLDLDFPTVEDGARGVHFIHAAVRSGREGGWVDAAYAPAHDRVPLGA